MLDRWHLRIVRARLYCLPILQFVRTSLWCLLLASFTDQLVAPVGTLVANAKLARLDVV